MNNKIHPSVFQGPVTLETIKNYGKLLDPVFRISDINLDSKIYHTWRMADLVDTVEDGKWAKFSFVEYLWLRTLESMRRLGCSVKLMKAIHNELFIRAYKENLGKKTLKANVEFLTSLSKTRPLTKNEEDILAANKKTLADKVYMKVPDRKINYFYQLVVSCFSNNNEVGILIYEDQTFSPYEKSLFQTNEPSLDLSLPHIMIPVSSFIKEFIANEEKEKFLVPTGILTQEELKVINLMRNKNINKIVITLNEKRTPIKIECMESGVINGNDAKKIMQFLGLKNYSSIDLKTRDGNTLSFTHGKKIFL